MAAGQGFKTFTTGEVLTATDVNGYLMQGVLVFASAAARNAAITSPQEGQFAFTKDTNSLWYYDGAAWVASGATGDIEGVTAGTGISGGGTSGTVTVTNSMATAIDAKGDLVVGTGADAFSRLAVGTNTYLLTADSAEATGLKWAAPASGGGMTLINSGGTALTSTTTTVSSIPGTYKSLIIYLVDFYGSSNDTVIRMYLNSDTTDGNYLNMSIRAKNAGVGDLEGQGNAKINAYGIKNASGENFISITLPDYANATTYQQISTNGSYVNASTERVNDLFVATWLNTAAITSIGFNCSAGTWSAGTIYIYGVN